MNYDYYGRTKAQIELDAQKIDELVTRLGKCQGELTTTQRQIDTLSHQDATIWGRERGATAFREQFSKEMDELNTEARRLESCFKEFMVSVRKAHGEMMTADKDAELALEINKSVLAMPQPKKDAFTGLLGDSETTHKPLPRGWAVSE